MATHLQQPGAGVWMTPDLASALRAPADGAGASAMLASIGKVLQNLVVETRTLIGAHYAAIRIALDERGTQIASVVSVSEKHAAKKHQSADLEVSGAKPPFFPLARPLRLTHQELLAHPAWKALVASTHDPSPLRGWLAVPLVSRDGRNFGVIDLSDRESGEFTIDDERLLQQLARIVSLAVENAWLFHATHEPEAPALPGSSLAWLQNEMTKILASSSELRHSLQTCADTLGRHLRCPLTRIWVHENDVLELRAGAGAAPAFDQAFANIPIGHTTIGAIAHLRQPRMSHAAYDGLEENERDLLHGVGLTSYVGFPLLVDDELEGVLAVFDRAPMALTTFETLAAVSSAIALQIKRHREPPPYAFAHSNAPSPFELEHAVISCNLDGVIIDWNRGAERLFGYRRRDAIGRSIKMLIDPARAAEHREAMEAVRCNDTISRPETVCIARGGRRVEVSLTASSVCGADGNPRGAVFVAHDLAPTKRLQQQFRQAQKMEIFGQLAGGVAHDFNNLLTVILGYSEIMLRRLPPGDPARDLLNEIRNAGNRAEALTRQLLAFTRKQVAELQVLDLNAVASDTDKMLRRLIGEDIIVTTALAPNLGMVKVDPGQMQQVILNIAINSRDAMPKGGKLTIETSNVTLDQSYCLSHTQAQPGNYVMLAITDTGVGMNAETKARIFEPLFTTKGPGKGTGLGLATVQSIVQTFNGYIDVYTELGQGTTFKVYLPLVHDSATKGKARSEMNKLPRGNETVLLVEDEDCVRSLARQVLEMCGYTVLEACDGADALARFDGHASEIDILVTDVVMPYLDGRGLADRLLAAKPELKVLFVSGYPNEAVVRHGILDAEFAFLPKPFTTGALADKVRQVLDAKPAVFEPVS